MGASAGAPCCRAIPPLPHVKAIGSMTATPLPAIPDALMERGVTLRLRRDDDDLFLRQVYFAYRWDEVAASGWPEETRVAFLSQQQDLQRRHYDSHYPGAAWGVIEVDGERAGRLYLQYSQQDLRIIDIAFLPQFRNLGIGGGLLRATQALTRELGGVKASIHVEQNNPALRLYQRLGFVIAAPRPPYFLLEWPVT